MDSTYGIDDTEEFGNRPWSIGDIVENGAVEWVSLLKAILILVLRYAI